MNTDTPLPDEYISPLYWPEFINTVSIPSFLHPTRIGDRADNAWRLWPVSVESYHSEGEPNLAASAPFSLPFRLVMWHRDTDTAPHPKGWVAFRSRPESVIGFSDITNLKEYTTRWSKGARRERALFQKRFSHAYSIERTTYPEFENAYLRGTIRPILKHILVKTIVKPHTQKNSEHVTLWVARRRADTKIVAGIATLDSPTGNGSYYLAGFYLREVSKIPLMTALIDNWFTVSQQKGLRFMHFGLFYQPGDPRAWKGYSNFKAKFGVQYASRPPTLYKWIRG